MISAGVEEILKGVLVREGAGVKVQRYIGVDRNNNYEPILLLDYFNSHDELDFVAGFPPHPHRGFETITYLLEGSITHEDNQGNKGVIGPGGLQWMTAGKGIIHSEMPKAINGHLHGLQLWLNLPAVNKFQEPKYREYQSSAFAIEKQNTGVTIKVLSGTTDNGTYSPIKDRATAAIFLDISLPKETTFSQSISSDYRALILVLSGEIKIQNDLVIQGELAILDSGEIIQLIAKEKSRCLLIGARKIGEPIVRHGPFVMNTQEEILQAITDLRTGNF